MAQYNARQAGITAAIVIAILIPVGCCLVCLIIRLRQHAIEQKQQYQGNYNSAVYKDTTTAAGYEDDRGGFFSRFQRGSGRNGRNRGYDSDSSSERKMAPMTSDPATHEGNVRQDQDVLVRGEAPYPGPVYDPGTESSVPSTPDSIKKIKQNHSRGSLNRNSVGMHPDPLLAMSHKSLPRGDGSRTNLMVEAGGGNSLKRDITLQNDSLLGRSATLPPPPSDLLDQSPRGVGGATLASPPASISRPSTSSGAGTLKSALKNSAGPSSSDDAGDAVMAAATAAVSATPTSPTFFDNRNPYSSTSSSNRSSAKMTRNKDRPPLAVVPAGAEDVDTASENTDNKYDGVYYTKEPLPRRKPVEFPDRNMDVDINMGAYKTHGNRPSDL